MHCVICIIYIYYLYLIIYNNIHIIYIYITKYILFSLDNVTWMYVFGAVLLVFDIQLMCALWVTLVPQLSAFLNCLFLCIGVRSIGISFICFGMSKFVVLFQLMFRFILVRLYVCSFRYYQETQAHNKLPEPLALRIFLYPLLQYFLSLRCARCFVNVFPVIGLHIAVYTIYTSYTWKPYTCSSTDKCRMKV